MLFSRILTIHKTISLGNQVTRREIMDSKQLIKRLAEYGENKIACDWDNVGLLVEPSGPLVVKKVMVTNDLTEPVLDEAIAKNVNFIISYHPAIFAPLKRLTQSEWKQRSIVKCIERRIAVYSPHTIWDAIEGGINDWIVRAFDTKKTETIMPMKSFSCPTLLEKTVKVNLSYGQSKDKLLSKVSAFEDIKFISEKQIINSEDMKQVEVEFISSSKGVVSLIDLIKELYDVSALSTLRIYDQEKPLMKDVGLGRIAYLNEPKTIKEITEIVKKHFNMKTFRLALANGKSLDSKINKLAAGAGSGSKILANLNVDIIITGELSHHEILHEVHRGVSVIVTDHTNTERGYFSLFKTKFEQLLNKNNENVEIILSEVDRDPLEYI